jgi:hypothetical protein
VPEWIRCHAKNHSHADTNERQADLPKLEVVVVAEDQTESTEKEVKNTKQDSRVDTKEQKHRFKYEKFKWNVTRMKDCSTDGFGVSLSGRVPLTDPSGLALLLGLLLEKDFVECLGHEEYHRSKQSATPDEEGVEGPAPA